MRKGNYEFYLTTKIFKGTYRTFHLLVWLFTKPAIMGQLSIPDLSYSVINNNSSDPKKLDVCLKQICLTKSIF